MFEPRLGAQHGREHLQRTGTIGDLSPRDDDAQDEPEGVYHQMPFSPSDLLSRIITSEEAEGKSGGWWTGEPHSGVVSHFNTLRVEDRSAGVFFFARFSRTASRR